MRNLRLFVLVEMVFIAIAWVVVSFSAPLYRATAEIVISPGLANDILRQAPQAYRNFISGQKSLILDSAIMQKTIKDLHLEASERFVGKDIAKAVKKYVNVSVIGETLIRVNVSSDEPVLSVRLAQTLAQNYIDSISKQKFRLGEDTKEWLQNVSPLAQEIGRKQEELKRLRQVEGLKEPEEAGAGAGEKQGIGQLKKQRQALSEKLVAAQKALEKAQDYANRPVEEVLKVADWPEIADARKELADADIALEQLTALYTEEHPDVVGMKARRNKILGDIKDTLNLELESRKAQVVALESQLKAIDEQIAKSSQSLDTSTQLTQQVASIQSEIDLLQDRLKELSARLDQQGYFPISVSLMGLTPEDMAPVVEFRDYKAGLIIAVLLGLLVSVVLGFLLKQKGKL